MTLIVDAHHHNEAFVRSTVAAFCVPLNPSIEEINDIKTAVSEAVTNCAVHGYEGRGGEIRVECVIDTASNFVHITVSDRGIGIDNIDEAIQPLFTTKPHFERSGMGFTVMQSFMDKLEVKSEKGKGTTIELFKSIANL
ncbi:MAG: anti-sigma F factor [Firmicutes bacterium]|nr:anti-sigma F factor [Bacillota bacterium]